MLNTFMLWDQRTPDFSRTLFVAGLLVLKSRLYVATLAIAASGQRTRTSALNPPPRHCSSAAMRFGPGTPSMFCV